MISQNRIIKTKMKQYIKLLLFFYCLFRSNYNLIWFISLSKGENVILSIALNRTKRWSIPSFLFGCRSNKIAKAPLICPGTWRVVNVLVLFLMLSPSFSQPSSSVLFKWSPSVRSLNKWNKKTMKRRLVSLRHAHSSQHDLGSKVQSLPCRHR